MTIKTYKRDTRNDNAGVKYNGIRYTQVLEYAVQPEKIICIHDTSDADIQLYDDNNNPVSDIYYVSLIAVGGNVIEKIKTSDKNEANAFWKKLTAGGNWTVA